MARVSKSLPLKKGSIETPDESIHFLDNPSYDLPGEGSVAAVRSDNEDDDNLCPFCDEPMPLKPSQKLLTEKAILFALPNITKRIGHPNAMSLPFPQTASFCELHHAEKNVIPFGIRKGWPISIDFGLLEQNTSSFFLDKAQETWAKKGRWIYSLAGSFESFQVEQPGYYGQIGHQVIINTLTAMFMSDSSAPVLDSSKATPFTPEFFICRVLLPEVSMLLIAEDLHLPHGDPKIKATLEASRVFGNAVHPIQEDIKSENLAHPIQEDIKSENPGRVCEKSDLALRSSRMAKKT
ncbi:hypothetical protein DFH28DRAFT_1132002 [Melampsora americana]|nr:hypothetical protein DFH28DRAFT_1132002 [Melampsora americana]